MTHLAEDGYGARIRARFCSIPKAQEIRTKMIEGHLSGLSFTYEAIRSHRGMFDGQPARYLDELRVHEATVTPIPMNVHATASAKAGPGVDEHEDLDAMQRDLEAWVRTAQLEAAVGGMVANPGAARHALDLLERGQLDAAQDRLERWAADQHVASDAERAAARAQTQRDRANDYSFGLARVMASARPCGHASCMVGACAYAR